jgi:hypothetical protein
MLFFGNNVLERETTLAAEPIKACYLGRALRAFPHVGFLSYLDIKNKIIS